MIRRHTSLHILFILVCCAALVAGCQSSNPSSSDRPKVVIVSLVRHPLFDEVVSGIRNGLDSARYDLLELNANGEMDKLRLLAEEATSVRPGVIVPVSTPATLAVMGAVPSDQKVVFSFVANPSDVGMDNKPANLTGVSDQMNYAGIVDLIADLLPMARRIGMVYNPSERNSQFAAQQIGAAAKSTGRSLILAPVSSSAAVPDAVRSLEGRIDVIAVGSDNTVVSAMPGLVRTATELRTPIIAGDSFSVRQGALAAVSADYHRMGLETARIVTRLMNEPQLSPGSIEVVHMRGESIVVNTASAGRLGFTFPPALLSRVAQTFTTIAD